MYEITREDFLNLSVQAMKFGRGWQDQAERFTPEPTPDQIRNYVEIHWYESFASVLLAKIYLKSQGIGFMQVDDEAAESWALLLDTEVTSWQS